MKSNLCRLVGAVLGLTGIGGLAGAIELPPMTTQAADPAAESTTMNASVNALMVYGEDKFQMKSQRTITVLTKNINDPVSSLLEMPLDQALFFTPPEPVFRQSLAAGKPMHNERILRPLILGRIRTAPFVNVKISAGNAPFVSWSFRVTTGKPGATIFRRQGPAEQMPGAFVWDGRDDAGNPLVEPGRRYAWEFYCLDPSGKKIRGRKGGFLFRAVIYERGNERTVVLSAPQLFAAKSRAELSESGKEYLNETADYFREGGSDRLELAVGGENSGAAAGQSRILGDYLARRLQLEEDRIRIRTGKLPAGRVEIRFTRNH